ncbi:MAG: asparagine synthase (glutamine-hydrolyzing) [Bacillota bacterium]
MCGIIGYKNSNNITNPTAVLNKMSEAIAHRGENDHGAYQYGDIFLAHRRLSIIDLGGGHQPMSFSYKGDTYTIVYNGEIYNGDYLRARLTAANIAIETTCDTELVLKCFALDNTKSFKYLNGIYAFAIYSTKQDELYLVRDHMGVKPLFYYRKSKSFAFSSEIKGLFAHPEISAKLGINGVRELFGIAPARSVGKTIYNDIYELPSGHYAIFCNNRLTIRKYFSLKSAHHLLNAPETAQKLQDMMTKIVHSQLVSDVNIGMFLSGGVDSSIITALSATAINDRLKTFSVDYVDSDKNFVQSDFTPARDNAYINMMVDRYNIQHKYHTLATEDLFDSLMSALVARDYPAMADIDSSLLLFTEKVKRDITVSLSGEFADEIFCGYPWFYREDALTADTFPWSIDLDLREETLAPRLRTRANIKRYVEKEYKKACSRVPLMDNETDKNRQMKIMSYLTMYYFGANLLERGDRMSMANGMEVRVPFTDPDLVQFAYNIPWDIKNYGGYEKGILREAFRTSLPHDVLFRKKSPYPKSHDPNYANMVESAIKQLLLDTQNPIWRIVSRSKIGDVLTSASHSRPWFGQLMNKPQYLAFILQIAMWLEVYDVEILV